MSPDGVKIKRSECEETMQHVLTKLEAHLLEAPCPQGGEHSWSQGRCQKCQAVAGLDWVWQRDYFSRILQARPFTSGPDMTPHWTFIVDDLLVDPSRLFHSTDCGDERHYHYVTSVVFPNSCCTCLASVTHYEAISLDVTVEENQEAGEWHKCWYALPFCDEHSLESHSIQITDYIFPVTPMRAPLFEAHRSEAIFRVANREWGRQFSELNRLNGFGWGVHYFLLHGTEAGLAV